MPVHACARQGRVKRPELEPVQCPRGLLKNAGASPTQQGEGNLRLSQRLPVRYRMMPVHGCARQGRVQRPELEPVQCPRGFGRMPVHACARQGRVKRPEFEPVQCPRGLLKNAGASLTQQGEGNLRLSQRLPVRYRMMPVHGTCRCAIATLSASGEAHTPQGKEVGTQ